MLKRPQSAGSYWLLYSIISKLLILEDQIEAKKATEKQELTKTNQQTKYLIPPLYKGGYRKKSHKRHPNPAEFKKL